MRLFCLLSGLIAKDVKRLFGIGDFVKSRLTLRVRLLVFFNLVLCMTSLADTPTLPPIPFRTASDYAHAMIMTATRLPACDIPTWFLMCLVSVEIIHHVVFRFLEAITLRIVMFYLLGFKLNATTDVLAAGENWWFWNEAITMYAFYLVGILLRRVGALTLPIHSLLSGLVGAVALAVVFNTYALIHGPLRLHIQAVVILAAVHGQLILFPLTALTRAAAALLFGGAVASSRWLQMMGRNALTLFCLNGVFYHHLNAPVARWFWSTWLHRVVMVSVYCGVMTVLSLVLALPFVMIADRYLPQLVGRPTVDGPLLPCLLSSSPGGRSSLARS